MAPAAARAPRPGAAALALSAAIATALASREQVDQVDLARKGFIDEHPCGLSDPQEFAKEYLQEEPEATQTKVWAAYHAWTARCFGAPLAPFRPSSVRLFFAKQCVIASPDGGFVTRGAVADLAECSRFYPVSVRPGVGMFQDERSKLCLVWAQVKGYQDGVAMQGQQDFKTDTCNHVSRGDVISFAEFGQSGNRFCVLGRDGEVTSLCLMVAGQPKENAIKGRQLAPPVRYLDFNPQKEAASLLSTSVGCVAAQPEGGFITVVNRADEGMQGKRTECTVFEPVDAFAQFGLFRDRDTGLCLGWAATEAAPPRKEVKSLLGLRTSNCAEWQSWDLGVYQLFHYMGTYAGYCLQNARTRLPTGVCLRATAA